MNNNPKTNNFGGDCFSKIVVERLGSPKFFVGISTHVTAVQIGRFLVNPALKTYQTLVPVQAYECFHLQPGSTSTCADKNQEYALLHLKSPTL